MGCQMLRHTCYYKEMGTTEEKGVKLLRGGPFPLFYYDGSVGDTPVDHLLKYE